MNSQERIDKVLDRLKNVKSGGTGKWTALCPAHDDNERSLGIGERDDGRIWVKCHAGCTRDAVLAALNLESRDLLPSPGRQPEASQQRRIAATYDYTDESGNLLYQAVRFAPKGFAQRRPDGRGGWIWNLNGVRRVPYRLPELLDAVKEGGVVFICEGEKDCDNLWELDLPATTNAGGAGKWSDDFCAFFRGVSVVILPDNDLPGQEHAHKVAASLYSVADAVVVVDLPGLPEKGDVSDWLKDGGSCDQLVQLAMRAPIWEPKPEVPSPSALSSDERRNAQVVCLSDVKPESVSWLWRGRIPFGKLTLLDGDPGLGKSTLSLDLAARLSVGGTMPGDTTPVEAAATLLLTAEDGLADTVRPRLEAAGADVTRIHALRDVPETGNDDGRTTFRPPMLPDDIALMKEIVQKHGVRLIVIDPLMAFLSGRVKSFHDQDVRRALAPLAAMAEETGAAVLVLRHLNKMQGGSALYRGGGSIGIVGAARSALLVGKHPDDENRRVLAPVKNNLCPAAESLAFCLRSDEEGAAARIAWEGTTPVTADRLLAAPAPDSASGGARGEAEEFLRDLLAEGPIKSADVDKAARDAGIAKATLRRARDKVGVKARAVGSPARGGYWEWSLPQDVGVEDG